MRRFEWNNSVLWLIIISHQSCTAFGTVVEIQQTLLKTWGSYVVRIVVLSLFFFVFLNYRLLSCVLPAQEDFVSLAELEDSLLRNVFRGYQKWVRPVQHANDTITVRFGLKISQLVDVVRNREKWCAKLESFLSDVLFIGRGTSAGCVCMARWEALISLFSCFFYSVKPCRCGKNG